MFAVVLSGPENIFMPEHIPLVSSHLDISFSTHLLEVKWKNMVVEIKTVQISKRIILICTVELVMWCSDFRLQLKSERITDVNMTLAELL